MGPVVVISVVIGVLQAKAPAKLLLASKDHRSCFDIAVSAQSKVPQDEVVIIMVKYRAGWRAKTRV